MTTTLDIQRRLKALGYDPGPLDGIDGPKTKAAVSAFKRANGIPNGTPGWAGPMTLDALFGEDESNLPPWYVWARDKLGLREVTGSKHNSEIVEWVRDLGGSWREDETAWCGTFVGAAFRMTLPDELRPANPFGARNWNSFGRALDVPALGAVLVFWRGSKTSWTGHVGFYAGERSDAFKVLGGNQSNAVTETWISKKRLLGIRWPSTYPLPITGRFIASGSGPLSTNEA